MPEIDQKLRALFRTSKDDYRQGATNYVSLMRSIQQLWGFRNQWIAQLSESGPLLDPIRNPEQFINAFAEYNADAAGNFSIWAHRNPDMRLSVEWNWRSLDVMSTDRLGVELRSLPDDRSPRLEDFVQLIQLIVEWVRPMHLAFGPAIYRRDHHPLDRAREGIGWMGWVPFGLNPTDVPEAAIVREMNGGTLIVTQTDFWQAFPRHPLYSEAAIARAQEVEMRLNLLGVLPTVKELSAGTWGDT